MSLETARTSTPGNGALVPPAPDALRADCVAAILAGRALPGQGHQPARAVRIPDSCGEAISRILRGEAPCLPA